MTESRRLLQHVLAAVLWSVVATARGAAQSAPMWRDPSPHQVRSVRVADSVTLEVLDWGGVGRPIVLLAGLGNSAHVFDDFAQRLTDVGHVVAITRRGFGASSTPPSGYDVGRLSDDVLAVMKSLDLRAPVLIGHSIAGQELSAIASRAPSAYAGLVYVDALFPYAYTTPRELADRVATAAPPVAPSASSTPNAPTPTADAPATYEAMQRETQLARGFALPEAELRQSNPPSREGRPGPDRSPPWVAQAILAGGQTFTAVPGPVLVIAALPQARRTPEQNAQKEARTAAFAAAHPAATIVRLPNADHYAFLAQQSAVLQAVRAFVVSIRGGRAAP